MNIPFRAQLTKQTRIAAPRILTKDPTNGFSLKLILQDHRVGEPSAAPEKERRKQNKEATLSVGHSARRVTKSKSSRKNAIDAAVHVNNNVGVCAFRGRVPENAFI